MYKNLESDVEKRKPGGGIKRCKQKIMKKRILFKQLQQSRSELDRGVYREKTESYETSGNSKETSMGDEELELGTQEKEAEDIQSS